MKKILNPLFSKVLILAILLQAIGQLLAHIPLVISRSSDPDCIDNLAACRQTLDKVFVNIGYWPVLLSYIIFFVGLLLIPVYVIQRGRQNHNTK